MTTLRITNNSPEAMRFLEYARHLPFVEEDNRIHEVPHTAAELREAVLSAEVDIRAGRTYSMEQVRARFTQI